MRFVDTSRVRTRFNRVVQAADGTSLSVDFYLPPEPGRYPVLLTRVATDNNRSAFANPLGVPRPTPADRHKKMAAMGFIVAAADVRGRGDSDGAFVPFVNEADDGVATVNWLLDLDECNGQVGLFGSGYAAFCAWAALAAGAHVDAIASISPFGASGEGIAHDNGVLRLDGLFWLNLVGGREIQQAAIPPWMQIYKHLPIRTMDEALARFDTAWQDWVDNLDNDSYWPGADLLSGLQQNTVPALHITGWWDAFLPSTKQYFMAAGASNAVQELIIGPWDSAACRYPTPKVGGFDFGPRSLIDPDEELIKFFKKRLMDSDLTSNEGRVFVIGRNEWQPISCWPDREESVTYNLGSAWGANTRRGDGVLTTDDQAGLCADEVSHNAAMPVEYQPGFKGFANIANPTGLILDQGHITARDEALCFTSEPVDTAMLLQGQASLELTLRCDAPDADLVVLLSDVFPFNSRDLHLSRGVVRLGRQKGYESGKPVTLTVDLTDIVHELQPGHHLRLTLTPSLFPVYAPNPHGEEYAATEKPGVANISLVAEQPPKLMVGTGALS